jgi:hypothetical protein
MTAARSALRWDRFAADVAAIAQVPAEAVSRDARVIEDLGLDSLALLEVVVLLAETTGGVGTEELETRRWDGVRLGDLFDGPTHSPLDRQRVVGGVLAGPIADEAHK